MSEKTDIRCGDATALLIAESGPFDLIFCDIEKDQYTSALELARDRLRPGGIFAADNLLLDGKVLAADSDDASTKGMREFTRVIYNDPELFSFIIPIRDGMSISIKRR